MTTADTTTTVPAKKPVAQEGMKLESEFLKGNIIQELSDSSIHEVSDYSYELLKFHGTYQGYNRDTATERKKAKLEKEIEFMVRMRIPAGKISAEQYLEIDEIARKYANSSIKITTRETIQLHCVLKDNLKASIADINNRAKLSTLSACGDVVRNVTATNAPITSFKHKRILEDVRRIVIFCAPKSTAYEEIWLDSAKKNPEGFVEPLYGQYYLPRKFKIGLVVPEDNTIDVYSHDLGIVLVYEGETLKGYNLLLGGGQGMTHNMPRTFPRVASLIASVSPDDLIPAVEAVVKLQRDHGDRTDRKRARLKYLVHDKGEAWIREKLNEYFIAANPKGTLNDPLPMAPMVLPNHLGWHEQGDGKVYLGLPIPSGRIVDYGVKHVQGYTDYENDKFKDAKYLTGLKEVIGQFKPNIVLTADQNMYLADVDPKDKAAIEAGLKKHGIVLNEGFNTLERNFIACVALPTCGKALAEAERIQFPVVDSLYALFTKYGVQDEPISVRMTGCPNGCARPYSAEIGIVGRMPDHYLLFLGGDYEATRVNDPFFDKVPEKEIATALEPVIALFKSERKSGERFGDFCKRYGVKELQTKAIEQLAPLNAKWAKAA